ncbi:hypothetical protein ACLBVR_34835, partial [Pseudomonas aeruginosa]
MSEELLFEGEEHPHLLLVDDDPTFTRVLARAMSRRGLRVSTAGSAELPWRSLKSNSWWRDW